MSILISHLTKIGALSSLPGLVWAMRGSAGGRVQELSAGDSITDTGKDWYWLHFNLTDSRSASVLQSLPGLAPACRLLRGADDLQQVRSTGPITFGMIADLKRDISESRDDIDFLHFILTERLLITARRASLNATGMTRQFAIEGGKVESVEMLVQIIFDRVVDGVDRLSEEIARDVDQIEDRIVSGATAEARPRLGQCRRSTLRLHRHIFGLRLLFQRLSLESSTDFVPPPWLGATARRLLQQCELLDREIVALSERTRSLQEEVTAILTEETNKHLRVLSVLSILFMPPTFIAGLFGMNHKGMLFGEYDQGFWFGTALAIFSSLLVAVLLRRYGILNKSDEK